MEKFPGEGGNTPKDESKRNFLKGVSALGVGALAGAQAESAEAQGIGFMAGYLFGESDGKKLPRSPLDRPGYIKLNQPEKIKYLESFYEGLSKRIQVEQDILKKVKDELERLGVKK